MIDLASYKDHTLLAAKTTQKEIEKLCSEAEKYKFYAVCVNSSYVKIARECLNPPAVKIATTIGFPLGATSTQSKITEAETAITDGADEIDMVMNLGFFRDEKYEFVQAEIESIKKAMGNKILKIIIETCYLTDKEIGIASEIVMNAGADFVKTSIGFGSRGASPNDIEIIKSAVGEKIKIKASGGIKDAGTLKKYIKLGVHRIGTSSGISILS